MPTATLRLLVALVLWGGLSLAPALAQPIAVRVTPAGPLRFCGPGGRTLTATATNPGFASGAGFDDNVYAVARQADGQLLLGGRFFSYGGTARTQLARLAPDGTLDASFVASGVPASAAVLCLAVQADGKVLAGGYQTVAGSGRGFLMRFNANGSPDASFAVTGSGSDFSSTIDDIIVQPDGTILVSGDFSGVGSTAASHIVRLLPNGTLDAAFNGAVFINGTIFTMARQADGRVLIGGIFTAANGVARPCLARLNADGSTDASFAPVSGPAGFGFSTDVTDILIQPDNQVLIVGNFTSYDGAGRGRVARLNPNGTLDAGFMLPGTGFSAKASNLALQPDGKVLVGGFFTSFNGTGQKFLARLTSGGAFDATFTSPGTAFDAGVNATALLPDGTVLAGGFFQDFNGTAVGRVARLNADGTLMSSAGSPVPGVSYTWSNGGSGPSISVNGSGSYTATATAGSRSGTSNAVVLTVDYAPAITSFTPASGPVGTVVTITGTDLGTVASASAVTVNGTAVTALTVDPAGTSLTATVASGTTSGAIAVTTPCGTATSATAFTVTLPVFQLLSTTPGMNGRNATPTGPVSLLFNQPLNATAGGTHLFSAQGGGHRLTTLTAPGTAGSNSASLSATTAFRPGEVVNMSITTQARSTGGQALDRGHVQQFRVAAGVGPGSFAAGPEARVAGGTAPALGDVNGDGFLDLLTVIYNGSGSVSVRLGLAGGGFSATGAELAVGSYPSRLVLADFDNDGDLDLATADSGSSSGGGFGPGRVSVLLNTGSGSFGPATALTAGDSPYDLAAGDVDADGDLDLVVADVGFGVTNVYLLRNTGSGSFAAAAPIAVGEPSVVLLLADFNNDGYLDLAAGHLITGTATVRLGTGTGSFGGGGDVALGSNLHALAVGDFNSDGFPDLAAALADPTTSAGSVVVVLNNGSGGFGSPTALAVGSYPWALETGDLDGDGDLDLAMSNRGVTSLTPSLNILLNNGSGAFSPGLPVCATGYSLGLALADLDGDRDLDMVTVDTQPRAKTWLNQAGAAISGFTPTSGPAGTVVTITGTGFLGASAVRFNGVAATAFTVNSVTSITATAPVGVSTGPISVTTACGAVSSAAPFTAVASFQLLSTTPGLNVGNVAGSAALTTLFSQPLDMGTAAAVHQFSAQAGGHRTLSATAPGAGGANSATFAHSPAFRPGEVVNMSISTQARSTTGLALDRGHVQQFRVAAGAGPGTFAAGPLASVASGATAPALGDVNGDGLLDLLTANSNGGTSTPGTVSVRLGLAGGGFSATGAELTVGAFPDHLVLADFDNDGDLDLATANEGVASGTVSVLLNNGSGSFGPASTLTAGIHPYALTTGDVDADGDLDLVVADAASGTTDVYLLRNTGTGSFGAAVPIAVGASSNAVALADFNNDGYLDLVAGHFFLGTATVRLGTGTGSFGGGGDVPGGGHLHALAVGDYNADGFADLALALADASTGVGSLLTVFNNGSGGFGSGTPLAVGSYPWALEPGDVDGDGDLDLVMTNRGISAPVAPFEVLLNNGSGGFAGDAAPCAAMSVFGLALADLDGDLDLDIVTVNSSTRANTWLNQVATGAAVSAFTPISGPAGTVVTITGTGFLGATAVRFNGVAAASFTVNSATSITATAPVGVGTGPVSVTTACGTRTSPAVFTATCPDLTVSTTQAVPAGCYRNLTVTSTGRATLAGDVTVSGTLTLDANASLADGCHGLTVQGQTITDDGATLSICTAAGLAFSGPAGGCYLQGGGIYSLNMNVVFNGTVPQFTGSNMLSRVRSLTVNNPAGLTLTRPLIITQTLALPTAGNLALNGQELRLRSDASGTALVVNSSTGTVLGGTAVVERYIAPAGGFAGTGYHHYAPPVSGCPVGGLATTGFAPVVNPAYNTSPTATRTTPFPTVFAYDQSRIATAASDLTGLDKGWASPAALTDVLSIGRGYAAHVPATATVGFTGTLNTGLYTLTLPRDNSPAVAAVAGWHLIGNPYPAPIDWSRVAPADRVGLDAAIYVFAATGAYTGSYRTYVNGIGGGSPLLAAGQGFFVHGTAGVPSATVQFRNAHRLTDYATQGIFQRSAADARPRLRLTLQAAAPTSSNALTDDLYLYTEAGATAGTDATFDALKMPNPSGLNLSAATAGGDLLAIQGLPVLAAATVVPLILGLPAAGAYIIGVGELLHFAPGTSITLHDALRGTATVLTPTTRYAFNSTVTAVAGRFWLHFVPAAAPLSAQAGLLGDEAVTIYPNPAHHAANVLLPAITGVSVATLTLLDALGRPVLTRTTPLLAQGTALTLDLTGLAAGIYALDIRAGTAQAVRRLVVE